MFSYFYHVCIIIFLLQGVSFPLLLVLAGVFWWRQSQRLEKLKKELDTAKGRKVTSHEISELILNRLPKLKPLNCGNCGAGVVLHETETLCLRCETRGDLPEDYAAAVSLKSEVKKLLKSAIRHWRVANILTFPLVGWIFFLLIFIEPFVLFPTALIGSNVFPNTWIDKAFEAMGETTSFLIVLSAFFGFIIWMIVFIFLTSLAKSLRRNLPVVPVFEGATRGRETGSCHACGGGIEYERGDFACICDYCNVVNFRVRFARRERGQAEKQKTETKSVAFGAMEILDDFVGTFFFVSVILVGASMLLTTFYAIKNLL